MVTNFAPPEKNSGAPHSSVFMCDSSLQKIFPKAGDRTDRANAFAAVPLTTGKTITSVSKISDNFFCKFKDHLSFPYDSTIPSFAAIIASITSGHAPVTLSELNIVIQNLPIYFEVLVLLLKLLKVFLFICNFYDFIIFFTLRSCYCCKISFFFPN